MAYSSGSNNRVTPSLSQEDDGPQEQQQLPTKTSSPSSEDVISFDEANGEDGFLVRDGASFVRVNGSSSSRQLADNSQFRFKLIVDYAWETQYLPGRLVATHAGSNLIAYIVLAKGVGAVRIMDLVTQERCLMKADKGAVRDMEFMHKADAIYIGFVDEYGTFYINKIHQEPQTGKLTFTSLFKVALDGTPKKSDMRRFIWCKFVPDEATELATKDCSYQFAVLQDDMIYAGHLAQMHIERAAVVYNVRELNDLLIIVDTHSGPVTDASFAPDGTALATSSKDGTIKFFQMYFQDQNRGSSSPRCLYSMEPHLGRPIDRLIFLDNHSIRPTAESQYWKFMLTFSENMSEMKLFTCKTWKCLQTVKFSETGQWKMELDSSAHYLLASDISQKAFYLVHLQHNDVTARVDWIREFSLPFFVLSCNLTKAGVFKIPEIRAKGLTECVAGDVDDYKADSELVYLETNIVQPKSLQQGCIAIDSPKTFCRTNNGHMPFSNVFGNVSRIDLEEEEALPSLEDKDEEIELIEMEEPATEEGHSYELQVAAENLALDNNPLQSLNASLGALQKKSSLSPLRDSPVSGGRSSQLGGSASVAQMSEQLSSLIGISPGGLGSLMGGLNTTPSSSIAAVRPPSSGHGSHNHQTGKSPSPARHAGIENLQLKLNLEETNGKGGSKASSSSSPSREVEEILSPKNTEIMSHRIEIDETSSMELGDLLGIKTGIDSDTDGFAENGILGGGGTSLNVAENHYQPSSFKTKHLQQNTAVSETVSSMTDLLTVQAEEMQDLKREIGKLHMTLNKSDELHSLAKLVDNYFKDSQQRMNRLEESIKKMEAQERLRANQAANNSSLNNLIPPNLSEVLAASVGAAVKKEIETVVPITLDRLFEPSRMNLSSQIDKMSAVLEQRLSSNLAHIFQREKVWDGVTANFKTVTKAIFEQTFNEIFTNTVYPRCQNATKEMFTQVNEAFNVGTSQYLSGLQQTLEAERKKDNIHDKLQSHMSNMEDALSSALQVEVESQMLRVLSGLQGGVIRQLEESISRELVQGFQEQKKYFDLSVLPRTVTPAVSVCEFPYGVSPNMNDPEQLKRSLVNLAKNGEIVQAFVQACNFGDSGIVLHLCKQMPANKVFGSKLPHQTYFSIIQSMVTEIHLETETKLKYLNAALTSIDTSDRKMLASLQRVFPVFQASVAKYTAMFPDAPLLQSFKILEMALMGAVQTPKAANLSQNIFTSSPISSTSSAAALAAQQQAHGHPKRTSGGQNHSFQY